MGSIDRSALEQRANALGVPWTHATTDDELTKLIAHVEAGRSPTDFGTIECHGILWDPTYRWDPTTSESQESDDCYSCDHFKSGSCEAAFLTNVERAAAAHGEDLAAIADELETSTELIQLARSRAASAAAAGDNGAAGAQGPAPEPESQESAQLDLEQEAGKLEQGEPPAGVDENEVGLGIPAEAVGGPPVSTDPPATYQLPEGAATLALGPATAPPAGTYQLPDGQPPTIPPGASVEGTWQEPPAAPPEPPAQPAPQPAPQPEAQAPAAEAVAPPAAPEAPPPPDPTPPAEPAPQAPSEAPVDPTVAGSAEPAAGPAKSGKQAKKSRTKKASQKRGPKKPAASASAPAAPKKKQQRARNEWGEHTYGARFERERSKSPLIAGLEPGTTLTRPWKGQDRTVVVHEDHYSYQGNKFPTLYAVTKEITGTVEYESKSKKDPREQRKLCQWSAARFWKLKQKEKALKEIAKKRQSKKDKGSSST